MIWGYENSPYIWPMLTSAAFVAGLAVYGWRHRQQPGGLPFSLLMSFNFLWAIGAALEIAAVDTSAKIGWFIFHGIFQLPATTASLWFALEYANLRRWLSRRVVGLLFFPSALLVILLVTNGSHHLLVRDWKVDGQVSEIGGPAAWVLLGYGSLVAVAAPLVFLWLLVQAPLHRRAAAACLGGLIVARVAYFFERSGVNPLAPMDATVVAFVLTASAYALALFRFRMFDLVPVARGTAIAQMGEGMLILDAHERILDLNPAAERILGTRAARVLGRDLGEVVPACGKEKKEISIGEAGNTQYYNVRRSALKDHYGHPLGFLILFSDITEQRRIQTELLEERSTLATLRERDRVARELHDGLAQVLAYVKMQVHSARGLLAAGQSSEADACLARLASAAQDAHRDVRDYIVGALAACGDASLIPSLKHYARQFSEACGIPVKLSVSSELAGKALERSTEAQLLRIIQEALTNVRKHAQAHIVEVRLGSQDGQAEAVIQDDGVGFRPGLREIEMGQRFGLHVMRERAEEVGGSVQIHSAPNQGTRVVVQFPLRKDQS